MFRLGMAILWSLILAGSASAGQQAGFYKNHEALKYAPKDRKHCGLNCQYSQALVSFVQSFQYQSSMRQILSDSYESAIYTPSDRDAAADFIDIAESHIGPFCEAMKKLDLPIPQYPLGLREQKKRITDPAEFSEYAFCYENYLLYHQAYLGELRRSVTSTTRTKLSLEDKQNAKGQKRDSLLIAETELYSNQKKAQLPIIQTTEDLRKSIQYSKQQPDLSKRLDIFATQQFEKLKKPRNYSEADFILFEADPQDPTKTRLKMSCQGVKDCICRPKSGYCFDAGRLKLANQRQKAFKAEYEAQIKAMKEYAAEKHNQPRVRGTLGVSKDDDQDSMPVKVYDQTAQYVVYKINSEVQNLVHQSFPGKKGKSKKDKEKNKVKKQPISNQADIKVSDKQKSVGFRNPSHRRTACRGPRCDQIYESHDGRDISATLPLKSINTEEDDTHQSFSVSGY